ncbi:iron uptake porin [Nostoc sp.]|uniref:iron uptake porin n=1 Tax=Nostoc sp. TaxID=1180 RepID=UPI002FF78692
MSKKVVFVIKIYQKILTDSIVQGVTLLSLLLLVAYPARAQTTLSTTDIPESFPQPKIEESTSGMSQVTNVNQLTDIQVTDWAFVALQSLVERYGCIAGYPNSTFGGNRVMTRYEFAAGLNTCLNRVNELIATATTDLVKKQDLATLQKLQEQFAAELATLRGRVDTLEAHTSELEANQFSTTTKLQGQVIISATAGAYDGNRITDATGQQRITNPNPTIVYRAGIDLNTSFKGTDLLKLRLETGSGFSENGRPVGGRDNTSGFLEPYFGSTLDYSINPPTNQNIDISRVYYSFKPTKDLMVVIGPALQTSDFLDFNSYAKLSFRDFSTQAFVNNYILFPVTLPSGGAVIDWKPGGGALSVRAAYTAADVANPGNQTQPTGVAPFIEVLYPGNFRPPGAGGAPSNIVSGGLFSGTYQGTVELEYAPSRSFALRLEYGGGEVFNQRFDVIGANVEFTLSQKFGIFGRYGYASYNDTAFGDIKPNYWMGGIGMRDLFTRGALAGIAVGQPFIANEIGNSTQTNFEAFYNYPFSRNIQITPTIQVINNAGNQESNGTIVTGTLRTVFSF